MVKYVLCLVTILLLVVDAFIYFDLKKYIKVHENELVENHIKGLLGRAVAMTVIPVCGRNSNYSSNNVMRNFQFVSATNSCFI